MLIILVLLMYGFWFIVLFMMFDFWYMFILLIQYMLFFFIYINVLNVYVFCNMYDILWGIKGDDKLDVLFIVSIKDGQGKIDLFDEGDFNVQYEREM